MKYRIKVRGYLEKEKFDWLNEMIVQFDENCNSEIYGNIEDQAALFGILKRIQSMGIVLISINQEEK